MALVTQNLPAGDGLPPFDTTRVAGATDRLLTIAAAAKFKPLGATGRDLRIDFFRGLALFFIFVDHIPNNVLSYFTFRSVAFCDAAELFYFLSGFVAAMVYGRMLRERGILHTGLKIYKRVWVLYVAQLLMFLFFIAIVALHVNHSGNVFYNAVLKVDSFLARPDQAVINALVLRFQPVYLDIFPLYILFLSIFPFLLAPLGERFWLVLIPSGLLYGAVQLYGWNLSSFPEGTSWYFNPLAWQFLFLLGACCGHPGLARQRQFFDNRWILMAAIVMAGGSLAIQLSVVLHGVWPAVPVIGSTALVTDKTGLAPLRLLNFLALALVVSRLVPRNARFLASKYAMPVVRCGQQSLYVFSFSVLLALLGRFVVAELDNSLVIQLAIAIGGIGVLMGLAAFLSWCSRGVATVGQAR